MVEPSGSPQPIENHVSSELAGAPAAWLDGGPPTAARAEGLAHLELLEDGEHRAGRIRRMRARLADGAATTVHVASYEQTHTRVRVQRLPGPEPLLAWSRRTGISDALVGGFFIRASGAPLGELHTHGVRHRSVPFAAPWDRVRACVHTVDGTLVLARRNEIEPEPPGDLLQAGPLLVRDRRACVEGDPEGFSAADHQFDTDITEGRYPRSALGTTSDGRRLAVVSDGRAHTDAGLTLSELADTMVALGAERAINLDGGASAALVCAGRLRNTPRSDDGHVEGGRPVVTALVFATHHGSY